MFVQWDTSQDGQLSFDELRENMADISNLFQLSEPDVLKMLQAADTNGDGHVDYSEFLTAAFDKQKLISEPNLVKAFQIFDIDGDGQISPEELQKVFGSGASVSSKGTGVWQQIMAEVDADGDGKISFDEFKNTMFDVIAKRASL